MQIGAPGNHVRLHAGIHAEFESLLPRGREKRGRAGSSVSGSAYQEKIERAAHGRAGMHGGKALGNDAKGLRPLGPCSESIRHLYGSGVLS